MARFDAATHPVNESNISRWAMYVRIPSADDFVAVSNQLLRYLVRDAESLTPANEFGGIAFTNINGTKAINTPFAGTDGGALRTVAVPATNFPRQSVPGRVLPDAAGMHLYVEATDGTKASAMTAISNVPVLTTKHDDQEPQVWCYTVFIPVASSINMCFWRLVNRPGNYHRFRYACICICGPGSTDRQRMDNGLN